MPASAESSRVPVASTVALLAATRGLDRNAYSPRRFFAHFRKDHSAPSYDRGAAIATITIVDGDDHAVSTKVEVSAHIKSGYTDATEMREYDGRTEERYSEEYAPTQGFVSFSHDAFVSAVQSVPKHARITLGVYLDAGNLTLIPARLHCDNVYLIARWTEGKHEITRRFLIDTSTGPHNSARFGNSTLY